MKRVLWLVDSYLHVFQSFTSQIRVYQHEKFGKNVGENETSSTVEFRFFEPPRETKIGSKNRRVRELQCSTEEGKQLLVRVIGRFEKMKVREIGIPLYLSPTVCQRVC